MLRASDVAEFLGSELVGGDEEIESPKSVRFNNDSLLVGDIGIPCSRPRLAFAQVLQKFFASHHLRKPLIRVGLGVDIKQGASIGRDGFGYERDDSGVPVKILHFGGVSIGDHVEIGACTIIARGTIADTVIGNNVKLDDNVFIAHNVQIGDSTMVVAGAVICGSVQMGKRVWVGASACIREGLRVGDDALIGMGAVVVRDVEPNEVVAGNPAKHLRWRSE